MEDPDASGDPDPPPQRALPAARIEIVDRSCPLRVEARRADSCRARALSIVPLAGEAIDWIALMGERALAELRASGELRVAIVADEEMARAHERDTGTPGTTDVLTYDLSDGSSARTRVLDADVLVCADEARRQSAARGHSVERELLLYVVHGALHCLGFDDADGASSEAMHAEEDRLLDAIGVGATFAGVAPGGGGAA